MAEKIPLQPELPRSQGKNVQDGLDALNRALFTILTRIAYRLNLAVMKDASEDSEIASFLAYNSSTDTNVTGDGTQATIDFDTEVFDTADAFAADTFTAPKTGKYLLTGVVLTTGFLNTHVSGYVNVETTQHLFRVTQANPFAVRDSTNDIWQVPFSVIAPMTVGDTATVDVTVAGGTKVVDVFGAAGPNLYTFFSGRLLP